MPEVAASGKNYAMDAVLFMIARKGRMLALTGSSWNDSGTVALALPFLRPIAIAPV